MMELVLTMTELKLTFEWGSAYDLFISLQVLHDPAHYGVRPAWAAGVRSRLSNEHRETLEQAHYAVKHPLSWIKNLSCTKDPRNVLWELNQIPPAERLPALVLHEDTSQELEELLLRISSNGSYSEQDITAYQDSQKEYKSTVKQKQVRLVLDAWANAADFGERYLQAIEAYNQVFFSEDARRIEPRLVEAVEQAQSLAGQMSVDELLLQLSQGVRFEAKYDIDELILVPSYWITPLVIYYHHTARSGIFVFGARPADESLVPGEQVPDAMLRALKALADPTRLRILRYLANEQITPADLSRRLRLRAPTVTHHLNTLRLAGLVYLSISENGERHYQARLEMIDQTIETLNGFIEKNSTHKR